MSRSRPDRLVASIAAGLIGVVVIVLAAAGCGGVTSTWTDTFRDCRKSSPPCTTTFDMLVGEHEAPAKELQAARLVAGADATLAGLLARGGSRLRADVTWRDDEKRIGVMLLYVYPRPIRVDQVLPYVATVGSIAPSHGDCVHPYLRGWLHVTSSNVRALWVRVDLRRRTLVAIDPFVREGTVTYSWVRGRPHPKCVEYE